MWVNKGVIGKDIENLAPKSGFGAVLDSKLIFFTKYAPSNLLTLIIQVAQSVALGELLNIK